MFLFGARGTGKTTFARQCDPDALYVDLRTGPDARLLASAPERLHDLMDSADPARLVIVDEIQKLPGILDVVHQRLDREPARRFLLTGSSARAIHRPGVNLLGGRAGKLTMPGFLACELNAAFDLHRALRVGMLPLVCTNDDPERAISDYVTTAVIDEVRAEIALRRAEPFSRALDHLALSHGGVLSISTIAQHAGVARNTVEQWIEALEQMFLVCRLDVFSKRPSRRALANHPKLYFTDTGIASALRTPPGFAVSPDALGAALEGLVFQHLHAWVASIPGASLSTWRTSAGVEVDFVVHTPNGLLAIEVKHTEQSRSSDRRGLLAFHDEFPDARLLMLTNTSIRATHGRIVELPCGDWLTRVVPGTPIPTGVIAATE